jgi:hypothetical protein
MELAVHGINALQVGCGGLHRRNLLLADQLTERRGGEERKISLIHVSSFHGE